MEDELNLDLELDNLETQGENNLKVKNRIQKLAENVRVQAQEKDQALATAKTEADARALVEKERDFYKDFSTQSTTYPAANEHQTEIWDKVKAGYSIKDATVSVLNEHGKLPGQPIVQTPQFQPIVEGGSASTVLEGGKSNADLSLQEKRAKLQELDFKGELWPILKSTNTES